MGLIFLLHGRFAHTIPLATNTRRVSLRSNGNQANDNSFRLDISADGRYVAFASDASNLVNGDNNNARDIFVRDRQTGTTQRVSVNSDGVEANFDSDSPSISDNGRFVAFHSFATNLRSDDTNGVADIFLHDRQTGETTVVNRVLVGQVNDISYDPDISGNGQYITFWSYASNLVGGDNNNVADIFRFDRLGLTMFRVSLDSNGVEGNGHSSYPSISQDGRYIAFESDASNLAPGDSGIYRDIFWHDMDSGETKRLSVNESGSEANGDSVEAVISANGRYVAFSSRAIDIIGNDTNVYSDIFLRDTDQDATQLITAALGDINTWETPSVSGNGRYIAFRGRPAPLPPNQGCSGVLCEIFVYDRQMNTTSRVSVSSNGTNGNDDSQLPAMAADGRYAAFSSVATNLVANDTNSSYDIFVREFLPSPTFDINYRTGRPASFFALSGTYYIPDQSFQVAVNGVTLGNVTADDNGNINFRLQTQNSTEPGTYYVAIQNNNSSHLTSFRLNVFSPLRAASGSGPTFVVPNGIAFTHYQYLPLVVR